MKYICIYSRTYVEYSYVTYVSIIHMQTQHKIYMLQYIVTSTLHVRRLMHACIVIFFVLDAQKAISPKLFSLLFLVSLDLYHLPSLAPHTYIWYIYTYMISFWIHSFDKGGEVGPDFSGSWLKEKERKKRKKFKKFENHKTS